MNNKMNVGFKNSDDCLIEPEKNNEPLINSSGNHCIQTFDDFANVWVNGDIEKKSFDPLIEFIIAANFSNSFADCKVINIIIDSEGGDLFSAIRMMEVFDSSIIPIRTIGLGQVCSAALLLLMAGHERWASRFSSLLSHNATFNYPNFSTRVNDRSHAKNLDIVARNILQIYEKYTQKNLKYIKKHLITDFDVFLTPEEALHHGLIDGIIDGASQNFANLNRIGE